MAAPQPIPVLLNPILASPNTPSGGGSAVEPPPPYTNALPQGNRPTLPYRNRNRHIGHAQSEDPDALVVKFQTIVREEREIVVGRLKIATNEHAEHAFILRRYDTGAISVTTMYKAAFPTASQEEEDREMRWIKSTFDLTGMNGSRGNNAVKLAGNWIPPALATHLAPAYKLTSWIHAMVEANPEAGVAYRKSQRSQQAAEEAAIRARESANGNSPAHPANAVANAPAPAAPAPAPVNVAPRRSGTTPTLPTASPARAPKRARHEAQPEAPINGDADVDMVNNAPSGSGNGSRQTVAVTLQSITEMTAPANIQVNAEAEAAESRALVQRMTAEYQARSAAGESAADMGLVVEEGSSATGRHTVRGVKRTVEEAQAGEAVAISGGTGVTVTTDGHKTGSRLINANKRVNVVGAEEANRGARFWGPAFLAFGTAVGLAAANYLL